MGAQWTPQMAENLRWLLARRGMSAEDLRYRLGYASRREAERLMTTTEAYRPRKITTLDQAVNLSTCNISLFGQKESQFRAWVEFDDLCRRARAVKTPKPRWLRLWYRVRSAFCGTVDP